MNKNKLQEKDTNEQSETLSTFNARRKLIKGAAIVAPAIITLKSGAAMALTSQQCIVRDQKLANDQFLDSANSNANGNGNKPAKFTNSESTFLRTQVTIAQLSQIKIETNANRNNPKFVFDKKNDGSFKRSTIYIHGHGLSQPFPSQWASTGAQQQLFDLLLDPIDVYDTYASATPAITGGVQFKQAGNDFVLAKNNGKANVFKERFGLVVTDMSGNIQEDILTPSGPRVGRFSDHADLAANNHITGSCWASINP